jgi:hypothetical protein
MVRFSLCLLLGPSAFGADAIYESCFLAVPFIKGGAFEVRLKNESNYIRNVTIQRFASDGTAIEALPRAVAPGSIEKVRLELDAEKADLGWLRVLVFGTGVNVSGAFEWLSEDTVTTLDQTPVFRDPRAAGPLQIAQLYSLNHKYTADILKMAGAPFAYFFANLSEYPVRAGICQAQDAPCPAAPLLDRTVPPGGSVFFRIDPTRRFILLESTPGYSAAVAVTLVEGLRKTFGVDSSITFGPVK